MVVITGANKVKVLKKRTGMIQSMSFKGNTLIQEPLHVRVFRVGPIAGDADWSTAIDDFQSFDNRCLVVPEMLSVSGHVIDCEDDDSLDALFTDPLWSRESGRTQIELLGVVGFVEMCQSVP